MTVMNFTPMCGEEFEVCSSEKPEAIQNKILGLSDVNHLIRKDMSISLKGADGSKIFVPLKFFTDCVVQYKEEEPGSEVQDDE